MRKRKGRKEEKGRRKWRSVKSNRFSDELFKTKADFEDVFILAGDPPSL